MNQSLVDELAGYLLQRQKRAQDRGQPRFMLGITGPPAAGKSTLAALLCERCDELTAGAFAADLPMDGYHLRNDVLDRMGMRDRKGVPRTFDAQRYVDKLRQVRDGFGQEITSPAFERSGSEEPAEDGIVIEPSSRLIITEGNYLLLHEPPWNEIVKILDEIWYVDVDRETVRRRSLLRHQTTGNDPDTARDRVENNDLPNYDVVATTKNRADRVIPGDFPASVGCDYLKKS